MAQQFNAKPPKTALLESIRSIGYNFNSALADIIDNSISAGAKNVEVIYIESKQSLLIIDDGKGMTKDQLDIAMELGTLKRATRNKNDLGRFGLGMKTAAFSQCKRIDVTTKAGGIISSMFWDLDIVEQSDDWLVGTYSIEDIFMLPYVESFFSKHSNGTIVMLSKFDRIKSNCNNLTNTLQEKLLDASGYLSLVFHKFIAEKKITITINGNVLKKLDPFLIGKSLKKNTETIKVLTSENKTEDVTVTGYVLPYFKDLEPLDFEKLGTNDNSTIRNAQGFYIYRGDRLIIWGTWLCLSVTNELYKGSRIEVCVPNSLDDMWEIDVKKANAVVPIPLKRRLKAHIEGANRESRGIATRRTEKFRSSTGYESVWLVDDQGTYMDFVINNKLPLVTEIKKELGDKHILLDILMKDIAANLPKGSIYTSMADIKYVEAKKEGAEEIRSKVVSIIHSLPDMPKTQLEKYLEILFMSEPYCDFPNIMDELKENNYDLR